VTTETGECVDDVYFGESFVAAEMSDRGGIPGRLYGVRIKKIVVKKNRCSSNDVVKGMTIPEQTIEFVSGCREE
jgi:hypothetical protein